MDRSIPLRFSSPLSDLKERIMQKNLIVLEFNELSPELMDRFIAQGHLPNFEILKKESDVFISDTIDHGSDEVEPWVQYCTSHTGVRAAVHQVMHLGSGNSYEGPRYWDVASQAGRKVMIWSSMNAVVRDGFKGVLLPDPWAGDSIRPTPSNLESFYSFVSKNVQDHTKPGAAVTRFETLKFLWFIMTHGVSIGTFRGLASQLMNEKKTGRFRWRRAFVLDRIIADIFCHFYSRFRPDLATFFLNSTAFVQHRFWRNMDPDAFQIKPTEVEQAELKNAVLEGYQNMDRILGKLRKVAEGARFCLVTAHSQQPHLKHESSGGKVTFRPKDFQKWVVALKLPGVAKIEPVMTEQFRIFFHDQKSMEDSFRILSSIKVETEPAISVRKEPNDALFCGCSIHHSIDKDSKLNWIDNGNPKEDSFYALFYLIAALKSGRHHPDGIFWVSRDFNRGIVHEGRVPVGSVAATVLNLMDLPVPVDFQTPAVDIPTTGVV